MNNTYNRILNLMTEMDVKKSLGKLTIREPLTPAQQKNRKAVNADIARMAAGKEQQKYAETQRQAKLDAK
tara:strand:+ start:1358 stop:1567 length:210 start_codon:yes stop_codon:yes gene_type:complete